MYTRKLRGKQYTYKSAQSCNFLEYHPLNTIKFFVEINVIKVFIVILLCHCSKCVYIYIALDEEAIIDHS